jgi:hypothetical protein
MNPLLASLMVTDAQPMIIEQNSLIYIDLYEAMFLQL